MLLQLFSLAYINEEVYLWLRLSCITIIIYIYIYIYIYNFYNIYNKIYVI